MATKTTQPSAAGAVPVAPAVARTAGPPHSGRHPAIGASGWRLPVTHAGSRLEGFASVTRDEAREIFEDSALYACDSLECVQHLLERLSGTVVGLLAELDMRDEIGRDQA